MNADESRDLDELLWRQVHPKFLHDGRPTSQTFRPSPKDEDQLSVDRASLTTAADSYGRYVRSGFLSEGVLAVTVGQCEAECLAVRADPVLTGDHPNSAHALIDFRTLRSRGRREAAAKALTAHALARGWQVRRP
jgi:hypothetical protein